MNYIYRTSGYIYILFLRIYSYNNYKGIRRGRKTKNNNSNKRMCVRQFLLWHPTTRYCSARTWTKEKKTNPELPTSGLPAILCPLHERIVNDDGPVLSYYPSSSILKLTSLGLAWLKGSFPIIMMSREQPKFEVFCFLCPPPARYLKDSFTVRRIRRRRHQREK